MELIERLETLWHSRMSTPLFSEAIADKTTALQLALDDAFPELAAHIKAQAAEIVRLENLEAANVEHDDLVFHKYRTQAAEINNLKQCLYDETEGITATLRNDRIAELEAQLATCTQVSEWAKVSERLPEPGKPVLVVLGKKILRAVWMPKHFANTDSWGDFDEGAEWLEDDGVYCWPEGWYEWNGFEECHWKIDAPEFWQLLPALPIEVTG